MIKTLALAGLITCIPSSAGPQDVAVAKEAAAPVVDEAQKAFDQLIKDYDAEVQRVRGLQKEVAESAAYKEARENKDREKMMELRKTVPPADTAPFITRAQESAKKFAGTEGAVEFLAWTAGYGKDEVASNAFRPVDGTPYRKPQVGALGCQGLHVRSQHGPGNRHGFLASLGHPKPA